MDPNHLTIVILCLAFSAFFSGVEIAYVSANKLQIQIQVQKGNSQSKILAKFLQYPSRFISTLLVGNNIALVVYGVYMAFILEDPIKTALPHTINTDAAVFTLQTIISTLVVLLTAEFLPKSLAMVNPERLMAATAIPMRVIQILLYPFVSIVVAFSRFAITKIFRLPYQEDKPVYGFTDLNQFIKKTLENQEDTITPEVDAKIFNNALDFKTVRVRECLIPRTEIVAVDINNPIEQLKQAFIESGHSKILIYKDTIDEIIGYSHSIQLFTRPENISDILTPIIIVTETMLANELMIQFLQERKSIALVVDEFGGTSGIVTMEDIIEEIFGEIKDEHDSIDLVQDQIAPNVHILSARLEIDHLNETNQWTIPEGEYDTLGGFILSAHEDIPDLNQTIDIPPFSIKILNKDGARIDLVQLTYKPSQEPE